MRLTKSVTVPAIRHQRLDKNWFSVKIPVNFVLDHMDIPWYDPKTRKGYQRKPTAGRIPGAAAYVKANGPNFPDSVTLNLRKNPIFKPSPNNLDLGVLELGDETKFFVVDGQTRLEGMKKAISDGAKMEGFTIMANISVLSDVVDEMLIFRDMNSKAKAVPQGLVNALMAQQVMTAFSGPEGLKVLRDQKLLLSWKLSDVIYRLNSDVKSPLKGLIQLPNEEKLPGHVFSYLGVLASIKPAIVHFETISARDMVADLVTIWTDVLAKCPKAKSDPRGHRYLWNTTGLYILHNLYRISDRMVNINNISVIDDDYWSSEGKLASVGGVGGFKKEAKKLWPIP
jgi:DGQHR domain-containing protein